MTRVRCDTRASTRHASPTILGSTVTRLEASTRRRSLDAMLPRGSKPPRTFTQDGLRPVLDPALQPVLFRPVESGPETPRNAQSRSTGVELDGSRLPLFVSPQQCGRLWPIPTITISSIGRVLPVVSVDERQGRATPLSAVANLSSATSLSEAQAACRRRATPQPRLPSGGAQAGLTASRSSGPSVIASRGTVRRRLTRRGGRARDR